MTIIWKTKSEQEEHFHSIIHARRSISPNGRMTAVELGRLSRQVTDAMGIPNATIPGTARIDSVFSYAKKHGLQTPNHRISKAGRRLDVELVW